MPSFGNWTVYMDIPVPFSKYIVVLDIGRHGTLGYRLKTGRKSTGNMLR